MAILDKNDEACLYSLLMWALELIAFGLIVYFLLEIK